MSSGSPAMIPITTISTILRIIRTSFLFPAVSPGAAIVFFTDEFVQAGLRPLGVELHLKILGPRRRKDLGIINRQLVSNRVRVNAAQPFDGMKLFTVHSILCRVRVVIVIERPSFVVRAVDHESIPLPVPHGIAIESWFDTLLMRTAIQRDEPRDPLKLGHHDEVVLRLNDLDWVRPKEP